MSNRLKRIFLNTLLRIQKQPIIQYSVVKKPSILLLIFYCCFAFWFNDLLKPYSSEKNETNFVWDGMGYYAYLPSTFYYNGTFEFKAEHVCYLPINKNGKRYTKYPYGVALIESPFYGLAYFISVLNHKSTDGFSSVFADYIRLGNILWVLFGLIFLRKFLLTQFNETVTAITLFCCLFGSMLYMYTFIQSEIAHGYLFALFSIFMYYTYKWHKEQKVKYIIILSIAFAIISITRFTEIYILVIFIFWDIKNLSDLKIKFSFFLKHFKQLLLFPIMLTVFWIPQFIYYKLFFGAYFVNPYVGEKFYWLDPQIINILFSYRKGWITYTPIVILAFIGMFFIPNKFKVSKYVLIFLILILIYVFSCWWDWGYGGCFGNRAFCQLIAVLSIPMASIINFVLYHQTNRKIQKYFSAVILLFIFSCSFLNIEQSFQYRVHGTLHTYNMSKNIYWGLFRNFHYAPSFFETYKSNEHQRNYDAWRNGKERDDNN